MQRQLTIVSPDPLLTHLVKVNRAHVIKKRAVLRSTMERCSYVLNLCYSELPDLSRQLHAARRTAQLLTRGAPATESVTETNLDSTSHRESVANAFLLKKAYKMAASSCHPDKGGSQEDFIAVNAAYKAGDLHALNEFVLHRERPLLDQLDYWKSQLSAPDAKWAKFRSTPEYTIVQSYEKGRKDIALKQSKILLELLIAHALMNQHQTP